MQTRPANITNNQVQHLITLHNHCDDVCKLSLTPDMTRACVATAPLQLCAVASAQ